MERCATCRHWRRVTDEASDEASDNGLLHSGWGLCPTELNAVVDRLGECLLAGSSNNLPQVEGAKAFAVDHEEYQAELITFDDFGCVQWAARG